MRPIALEDDLSELIRQAKPELLFDGKTSIELFAWQQRFRARLISLLGIQPQRTALKVEFESEVDCGTFVRHRIRYLSETDLWIPAYLLVPKAASHNHRLPGMVCLHGHGDFGKDSVVGLDHSPQRLAEIQRFRYDFGPLFAEDGWVVLAPDLRGFGERRPGYPNPRTDYCDRNYMAATLLGTTIVAGHLCDLQAALDVLQELDCLDPTRLACAGLSLGGRMAMFLAALDERVQFTIASGCLNLFQERFQALRACGAQLVPGLLRYGDTPEVFSLIAPRPLVIEWGLKDPLIPHEWAGRGLVRIRRAYEAAGKTENLTVHRFENGHVFDGTTSRELAQQWQDTTSGYSTMPVRQKICG